MKNKSPVVAGFLGLFGPFGLLYFGWFPFFYCLLCLTYASIMVTFCTQGFYFKQMPIISVLIYITLNVITAINRNRIFAEHGDVGRANTSAGSVTGTLLMLVYISVPAIISIVINLYKGEWLLSVRTLLLTAVGVFFSFKMGGLFLLVLSFFAKLFRRPLSIFDESKPKPKIDRKAVQRIVLQANVIIQNMLKENQIEELFKKVDLFYSESKMWPSGFKSLEELQIYLVVFAKYMSLYVYDIFSNAFKSEELGKLSYATILVELGSLFNNQKKSPNSNIAARLSQIIVNQELAMQASIALTMESSVYLESERKRVKEMVNLLASGRVMEIMNFMIAEYKQDT